MAIKSYEEWLNEGHSYDNEIENARMMKGSASELVEWAKRKIAESRPENFQEGVISPIQEGKKSEDWIVTYKGNHIGKLKIKNGTEVKVKARNTEEAHRKAAKTFGMEHQYHILDATARKVNESVNEAKAPKSWDTMFAMNVLKAYEDGNELLRKGDPKSIEKWDTDYNGGNKPKPSFETKAIIDYAISTGKKPNGDKFNESLNEGKITEELTRMISDGAMSMMHQFASEAKDEDDFIKKVKAEGDLKIKMTKEVEAMMRALYKDMTK